MTNDKSIREQVKDIYDECDGYLAYVTNLNECAYSDRILENIIAKCNTLSILHKNNKSELINERNFRDKYEYNIVSFWNDSDDLYVNYIITDIDTKEQANVINYFNTSDIGVENYNSATYEEIEDNLYKSIENESGWEFEIPKVSNLSPLLKYIYEYVCSSDINMCHISKEEWKELVEDGEFSDDDIIKLKEEVKKYNLDDVLTIDDSNYKICAYGCLQTSFNDDLKDRGDEFER